MAYWIARNNQKVGPYSLADAQRMMADGKLVASDLAWTDGMANWGPVFEVIPSPQTPEFPAKAAPQPLAATRMIPVMRIPPGPDSAPRPGLDTAPRMDPQPSVSVNPEPVQPQAQAVQASPPAPQAQEPQFVQAAAASPAPYTPPPARNEPASALPTMQMQGFSNPPAPDQFTPAQPFQPTAPPPPPAQAPPPPAQAYQSYPGPAQPAQAYPGPAQPAQAYPGPAQPAQTYPGPAQPAQTYPGPAQPAQAYPDQGYPGQGYPGQPYPGQAYPGQQPYSGQPMPAPPMAAQPMAAQPYQPAGMQGAPVPPGMHWALVVVLGMFTFGIFYLFWVFKQANFVARLDPQNPARKLYVVAVILILVYAVVVGGAVASGSTAALAIAGSAGLLVELGAAACNLIAVFKMRTSLLNYYNTVEPIGLKLSAVMTFFFNILYFQHHFHRIAKWKQTGILQPQA